MNLQVIKALDGRAEYVLLPMAIYRSLHNEIETSLIKFNQIQSSSEDDLVPFELEDYVENPVALARIKAGLTQKELAKRLGVTQAYVSKLENQRQVSSKVLSRLKIVLQ